MSMLYRIIKKNNLKLWLTLLLSLVLTYEQTWGSVLDAAKGEGSRAPLQGLNEELLRSNERLSEEKEKLSREKEELSREKEELSREKEDLNGEKEELTKFIRTKETEIKELIEESAVSLKKHLELTEYNKNLGDFIQTLEASNKELADEKNELSEANEKHLKTIQTIKTNEKDSDNLKERNEELLAFSEEQKQENEKLKEKNEELSDSLEEQEQKIRELKEKNKELSDSLARQGLNLGPAEEDVCKGDFHCDEIGNKTRRVNGHEENNFLFPFTSLEENNDDAISGESVSFHKGLKEDSNKELSFKLRGKRSVCSEQELTLEEQGYTGRASTRNEYGSWQSDSSQNRKNNQSASSLLSLQHDQQPDADNSSQNILAESKCANISIPQVNKTEVKTQNERFHQTIKIIIVILAASIIALQAKYLHTNRKKNRNKANNNFLSHKKRKKKNSKALTKHSKNRTNTARSVIYCSRGECWLSFAPPGLCYLPILHQQNFYRYFWCMQCLYKNEKIHPSS